MRYIEHYFILLALVLGIGMLSGCNDAEYRAMENSVYLLDADGKTKAATIAFEDGVDIPVTVRLAQKSDVDVKVRLSFPEADLESYNSIYGTDYVCIGKDKLPENAEILIPAGDISAGYNIHIDKFNTESRTYAIPVRIGEVVCGDVPLSAGQGKYIYVLAEPLVVSVPFFKGNKGQVNAAPEEWDLKTPVYTLEAWIKMDGYNRNNQAVFTTGSEETSIYIRFGDANGPYNYLQVKTLGGQIQTERDLVADRWYHWAFVYDGTNFIIYRDGQKVTSFIPTAPADGQISFKYFYMFGTSYFINECAMCQVRLWKTARSESEIQSNMYYAVNPANKDLIASWPMDEGEGTVFKDVTGNGHDAVCIDNVLQRWEHGIRFDAPK